MQLKAGRQQAERDFRASMQAQNQAIMGGVGDIVGAGIQGFAAGGGFTKDGFKMDTFLGRGGNNDLFTGSKLKLDLDGDGIPDYLQQGTNTPVLPQNKQ